MVVTITSLFALDIKPEEKNKSQDKIKIDIVSDVVCPWCAIGYQRLSQAIDELNIKDKVEITWHPFQLNPNMPREGQNADKYLMNKLRLNEAQLVEKRKSVTSIGKSSGFKFDYFAKMKKVNTFNAHILLDYAKEFGKQTELKVRLQNAYFNERKDISNRNVLVRELETVGLNIAEAMARLDNDDAILRVQKEEKYWRDKGVFAIPTMVFNNSIVSQGAGQVASYKELLTELLHN
jgi:predicted DsbA family dithiol-disulfide isomerase